MKRLTNETIVREAADIVAKCAAVTPDTWAAIDREVAAKLTGLLLEMRIEERNRIADVLARDAKYTERAAYEWAHRYGDRRLDAVLYFISPDPETDT